MSRKMEIFISNIKGQYDDNDKEDEVVSFPKG